MWIIEKKIKYCMAESSSGRNLILYSPPLLCHSFLAALNGHPLKYGLPPVQGGSGGMVLLGRKDTSGPPGFEISF